ncbi:FitA-like ribbon-helix-helix domain-containing protein [Nocardia sp. CA-128927]|uniref:FitA-like ribbon-helix-helix domain-containing protein n=1 Tax=Nocardia sp. CA-128927 TaxID=3239975 RepID=UPI003D989187
MIDVVATIKTPKVGKSAAKKPASSNLIVRNLDPAIKATIQKRATSNGRSMEAEVRAILARAVDADENPVPVVNPLSGAALLGRLAQLREALDGDIPEIVVRHDDSSK